MTIRQLPVRHARIPHATVDVPDGVPAPRFGHNKSDFGLPSERTVFEREFLVARRSNTAAVSRRERTGATRASRGHTNVRQVDRIDPFWELEWHDQFGGDGWERVSVARHRLTTDARGNVVSRSERAFAPIALPPKEAYTASMMRVMALLFQFGGLSTMQLCSFMDTSPKGLSYALNRLYAMGLVERMSPAWTGRVGDAARPQQGSGAIWRVNLRASVVEQWLEGLSPLEFALMTGGRDATDLLRNGTFLHEHTLRHNLSVAELCLRALETMPGVAGVWGEPFATGERFLSERVRSSGDIRYVRGDGVVVTKDGAVIIVELTSVKDTRSEHGATLAARAATWAAIAQLSEVPLSVVFVSIGGYSASRRIDKHLRENLRTQTAKYFPDAATVEDAMSAVHLVSAQAWWPSENAISRKFLTMEAYQPSTRGYVELAPADAQWDTTCPAVMNTVMALHTPEWAVQPVRPLTASAALAQEAS